jgi:hypothetical protein
MQLITWAQSPKIFAKRRLGRAQPLDAVRAACRRAHGAFAFFCGPRVAAAIGAVGTAGAQAAAGRAPGSSPPLISSVAASLSASDDDLHHLSRSSGESPLTDPQTIQKIALVGSIMARSAAAAAELAPRFQPWTRPCPNGPPRSLATHVSLIGARRPPRDLARPSGPGAAFPKGRRRRTHEVENVFSSPRRWSM